MSLDRISVGTLKGTSTVNGFEAVLIMEGIGVDDYVEVDHEGSTYLCTIRDCKRAGSQLEAYCTIIGQAPRTPFLNGSTVYRAQERTIRSALELTGTDEAGLNLGVLKRLGLVLWFPVKRIGRVFIVGKPGSGKSYTVGVAVEELLKKSIPVVIIDPHGEYSSLKVDGENAMEAGAPPPKSYIDQIIEFGDLEMNPGADLSLSALKVAKAEDLVLPGLCTIVNLRGLGEEEQVPIVSRLLENLFQASTTGRIPPFYCILDEAHRFAGKERSDASLLVRRFAQEGRKFGANLIVVTQRPQLLDTTVRGLVGTWIVHRLTDPNDVKIVMESGGLEHRWEKELAWLDKGEAIVTGEIVEKIPLIVKVRQRETRHGAPGFNPLEFVTPEAKTRAGAIIGKKKLELMKREAEGFEDQPILVPRLPQCFASVDVSEASVRNRLKQLLPGIRASMKDALLEYVPTIQYEVQVRVSREDPKIAFESRLTGLVSLGNTEIDWKQGEVFRVTALDLEKATITTKPLIKGKYGKMRTNLKELKELDGLLDGLEAYAALETTKVVFYHRSLGIFAVDTNQAAFLKECQKAINRLIEAKSKEISSNLDSQMRKVEEKIKDSEAEFRRLVGELKRVEMEARELRQQARLAEKAGKPTRKLELMSSARETRLTSLKDRSVKVEDDIRAAWDQRSRVKAEREKELAAVSSEAGKLGREEIGREVVQPAVQEIKVSTFQVVWIPIYRSELNLNCGDHDRTLIIAWNTINGLGNFGSCETCGQEVWELSANWLCSECLSMLCPTHTLSCSDCGRTLCHNHASICSSCGKVYCPSERLMACATCNDITCPNCSVRCLTCGSTKSFCKKHTSQCQFCRNFVCTEHVDGHSGKCSFCSGGTCHVVAKHCAVCGDTLCPSCVAFCSACGLPICKDHSWTCPVCRRFLCETETRKTCAVCGRRICNADAVVCSSCGETVCPAHVVGCPSCGRRVCKDCTITFRRLLVKRIGCKLCSPVTAAR